jgi:hypothetical protein
MGTFSDKDIQNLFILLCGGIQLMEHSLSKEIKPVKLKSKLHLHLGKRSRRD